MRISRIKFLTPILLAGRELQTLDTNQYKQYAVTFDGSFTFVNVVNLEGHQVSTPIQNVVWWHPLPDEPKKGK